MKGITYFATSVVLLSIICFSCGNSLDCTEGSGVLDTQEVELENFRSMTNSSLVDVKLLSDTLVSWKAQLKGDDNLLDLVDLVLNDNVLVIDIDDKCITTTQALELRVQDTGFGTLINSGSGDISGSASLNNPILRNSGSGEIRLTNGFISGALNITNSGSGDVITEAMNAEDVIITNSGSGDVYITAKETIEVTISGSGDVYYRGDPVIAVTISGSGELIDNN